MNKLNVNVRAVISSQYQYITRHRESRVDGENATLEGRLQSIYITDSLGGGNGIAECGVRVRKVKRRLNILNRPRREPVRWRTGVKVKRIETMQRGKAAILLCLIHHARHLFRSFSMPRVEAE